MIKISLIALCLCVSGSISSQVSTGLQVQDTRSINDLPSFNKRSMRLDLKNRTLIGAPGSGTFSTNLTLSPWEDRSGGLNHQLSFNNGGIFYRTGNFDSQTWNAWRTVITEDPNNVTWLHNINLNGRLTASFNDNFTYKGTTVGNYALQWSYDSWYNGAYSLYLAGFGGIKMFAGSTYALGIHRNGNVGIGTENPLDKLHVAGAVRATEVKTNQINLYGKLTAKAGDDLTYQGTKVGNYSLQWLTDSWYDGAYSLYLAGFGGIKFFAGGRYMMGINVHGNVGIGIENPKDKLEVAGSIRATEVKIEALPWADFVFDKDYNLPSLSEVESHIEEHKHLPGIPGESEVQANGVSLGEMQVKLLQKIEELTLYVIQQNKEIQEVKKENQELRTLLK